MGLFHPPSCIFHPRWAISRRLRSFLFALSTLAFDSLSSHFAHRYPRGGTVYVARPARSILLSTFALLLSIFVALPSARAYEFQNSAIWDSSTADSAFTSGPAWFSAGPAWLMHALPGSHFRARPLSIGPSGDTRESTPEYNGYVGTLHDVFNVSLFNNISMLAGPSGSKTSTSIIAAAVTPITGDTLTWDAPTTATTSWTSGANAGTVVWYDNTQSDTTNLRLTSDQNKGYNFVLAGAGTNSTVVSTSMVISDSLFALSVTFQNNFNATNTLTLGNGGAVARTFTLGRNGSAGSAVAWTITDNASTGSVTYNSNNGGAGGTTMALYTSGSIDITGGGVLNLNLVIADSDAVHTGGITKAGAGTLVLGGANLFTGGVTINAGTVRAGATTALGPAANATLTFGSGSTGKFQLFGNNTTIIDLKTNATVGTPIIENGAAGTATLTVNTANTDTYAGVLQNGSTGILALTKSGAGTLTLSGNNTYTGGTTITAGTITAGSSTAIGNGSLTFTNGSTGKFQLNGFDISVTDLGFSQTFSGSPIVENGAATPATLSVNPNITGVAFAGLLRDGSTGTLGLTINGGQLILYNTNTYTGDTTINAGILTFNSATSPNYSGSANNSTIRLGAISGSAPATLQLGGNPPNTITSPIIVQAAGGTEGTRLFYSSATGGLNTYGGSITMNTGLTLQVATGGSFLLSGTGKTIDLGTNTLSVNSSLSGATVDNANLRGTVTIADTMTSNSAIGGSLVKDGSNTLIIQSTGNTYTGNTAAGVATNGANGNGTRIGGGVLGISGDTSLGIAPSTATNNVFFTPSAINSITAPTLRADASSIILDATRSINIASSVTGTFDSNGTTFTIAGNINGTNGNLSKVGGGTVALTGGNTYTGTTTVNAGTLSASGTGANQSLGGTTGITVNTGGTLLQTTSDQINDVAGMTLNGGTYKLNGGVSEGTTAAPGVGSLTLASNSIINLAGTDILHFDTSILQSWTPGATLSIYNWNGTPILGGGAEQILFGTDPTGLNAAQLASIQFYGGDGTGAYTMGAVILADGEIVPVPEPSTWIGAALTLAAIGLTQRRRLRGLIARRA